MHTAVTYIHPIKSALRSPQGETVCQSSAQANKFFGVYQEMSVELDVGWKLKTVCQSSAQANKFFGVNQEMSVVELDVGGKLKKV